MTTQLDVQSAADVLHELVEWIQRQGTTVAFQPLPADTPCVFDGPTISLNPLYPTADHVLYLAHSFGSVVSWSLDSRGTQAMFDELRDAKTTRRSESQRFEHALRRFRRFEETAAEFGAEVLVQSGVEWWIPEFSEFFRADLDAITLFHREGVLPVWTLFFEGWRRRHNADAAARFKPRPIPHLAPRRFQQQEVKRGL